MNYFQIRPAKRIQPMKHWKSMVKILC